MISVGFTSNGKIIDTKASHICKENNLYENAFRDPKISIDDNWTYFESELALAIELLSNENLSALAWANVLVPFVASLLIRGPDFEERFRNRLPGFEEAIEINGARVFEYQRLLAIVSTAKWVVHRITKDPPLLTNELGYVLSKTGEKLEISISIPFANKFLVLSHNSKN